MTRPQNYTAKLEDKLVLNGKFVLFSFELIEPNQIDFQAGQYVSLQVSEQGERRSYSICSSPGTKHGFEIVVDISPGGIGCQFLQNLQFGDEVTFIGPMGRFVVPDNLEQETLVFVATGSGIAPFRSMVLDQIQEKQSKKQMILHWGLRYMEDLFWLDEFENLVESVPNFKFHPVLSRATDRWTLCRGRVTDCLNVHQLPKNAAYFLCGSKAMILDVMKLLVEKGVPKEDIYHEKFY